VFFLLGIVLLIFVPSPCKVVGAQTLVGKEAEVLAPCRPIGQVRIGGEIWQARCETGADAGEAVRVTGLDGLTLLVERV
jgi:membrane-bound serine protease (ClpP class)